METCATLADTSHLVAGNTIPFISQRLVGINYVVGAGCSRPMVNARSNQNVDVCVCATCSTIVTWVGHAYGRHFVNQTLSGKRPFGLLCHCCLHVRHFSLALLDKKQRTSSIKLSYTHMRDDTMHANISTQAAVIESCQHLYTLGSIIRCWQWSDGLSRMFTKFKSVAHVGWHSLGGKYKDSFCELKGIHKGDMAADDHGTAAAAEYARLCVNEHRGQQVHKM
ncbi:predicted protein [Lichtheimia corymbifera JMRC:FSU:9682]|uniref:Uncharacterized protein n=1 Tax=Lichtheimia corymbifera JMRC:FSU:9682 TaxID=1263082 RepID=A0A068S5S1_9FUNG|nr:predicted protein [Lichtheimia corymbifera JMRC:FSU:9682]